MKEVIKNGRFEKIQASTCGGVVKRKYLITFSIVIVALLIMCFLYGCSAKPNYSIETNTVELTEIVKYTTSLENSPQIYNGEVVSSIIGKNYTITLDISSCDCFCPEFELVCYQKNDIEHKNIEQNNSGFYTYSYNHRKIQFRVANYRALTYSEKLNKQVFNEETNNYITQIYMLYTSNIVVEIKCKDCGNINYKFELPY